VSGSLSCGAPAARRNAEIVWQMMVVMSLAATITARSSTLRSSRTLPGQLCRLNASITSVDTSDTRQLCFSFSI